MTKVYNVGQRCIYVFSGDKNTNEIDFFDKKTLEILHHNNIKIHFSIHRLYNTDSISIMKMKILDVMNNKDIEVKNLYLYSKQSEKIDKMDFTKKNILQNHDFFYNFFPLEDDCLYVSIEQDVTKEFIKLSKSGTSFKTIQENYFPKEKLSSSPLIWKKEDVQDKIHQMFQTQDMFHNIYHSRKSELPYQTKGIESLEIKKIANNVNKMHLPLEHIFKDLHVNETTPIITFQKKVRVFSIEKEKENENENERDILLKKVYPRMNADDLCIYIKIKDEMELYVFLNEMGIMTIKCFCLIPLLEERLNILLKKNINELISSINTSFSHSNFSFKEYNNLHQESANKIKWSCKIKIAEDVSILRKIPCISHLFTIYYDTIQLKIGPDDFYEEIEMRFKHTKNFDEELSQRSLLELYEKNPVDEIKSFISNYQMNYDEAKDRISFLKKQSFQKYEKKQMIGLLVKIKVIDKQLSVEIEDIDCMYCIKDLSIYLDCMIRLTQNQFIETYTYCQTMIEEICGKFDESVFSNALFNKKHRTTLSLRGGGKKKKHSDEDQDEEDEEEEEEEEEFDNFDNFEKEEIKKTKPVLDVLLFIHTLVEKPNYFFFSRIGELNLNRHSVTISINEKNKLEKEFPFSFDKIIQYDENSNYVCVSPKHWCVKELTTPMYFTIKKGDREKFRDGKVDVWNYDISPLDIDCRGYIPISVETFLNVYQERKDKERNYYLLRKGVDTSTNQSFLACLAEIYSIKQNLIKIPTIDEMRQILIKSLTLDLFVKYQNGSLVTIFEKEGKYGRIKKSKPTKISNNVLTMMKRINFQSRYSDEKEKKKPQKIQRNRYEDKNDVDDENLWNEYKDSFFIKKINPSKEEHIDFIMDTIASYENFLFFLGETDSFIDYEYLWDMIIDENDLLMKDGINLIILEILNNDVTENISLLWCMNSIKMYDKTKSTVILIKNQECYEPLYEYTKEGNIKQKMFDECLITTNIQAMMEVINQHQNITTYSFKESQSMEELMQQLNNIHYEIVYQVLNNEWNCIGLYVKDIKEDEKKGIFIPCDVCCRDDKVAIKYMDDVSIRKSLKETIERLDEIKKKSQNAILCQVKIMVQEDLLVIGIITETNQFISLSVPEINDYQEYDIPIINKYEIGVNDMEEDNDEISDRVIMVKKIMVEHHFYESFKRTLLFHLSSFSYKDKKETIMKIIKSTEPFEKKELRLIKNLHDLLDDNVKFANMSKKIILSFVSTIELLNEEEKKKKEYCLFINNKKTLLLPQLNLLTQGNNEKNYLKKLAKELILNKKNQNRLDFHYFPISERDYIIRNDETFLSL